jgi:hypothetical protein
VPTVAIHVAPGQQRDYVQNLGQSVLYQNSDQDIAIEQAFSAAQSPYYKTQRNNNTDSPPSYENLNFQK